MRSERTRKRCCVGLLASALCLTGASFSSVAQADSNEVVAIRAGKILTVSGPPNLDGVILIRKGKIVAVGRQVPIPAGARVIDARADVVMPGLVAAFSNLAERADPEEAVSPDICAKDGFDFYADNRRLLRGGLTTTYLATSQRRLVSGQGSVVKLAGETPWTRTLRSSADVRVALGALSKNPPALFRPPLPPSTDNPILPAQQQFPTTRPTEFAVLRQLFAEAKRLGKPSAAPALHPASIGSSDAALRLAARDVKLRPLAPILSGQTPLRVNACTATDIRKALAFADEQHIKIVLEGATEAYKLTEEIAKRHVPVVVETPLRPGKSIAQDYSRDTANGKVSLHNVAALVKAGVPVALAPASDDDLSDLLFVAASQVAYGVSPEEAVRMVTLDAAGILGVRSRVGSIEVGKDADLVILNGSPLSAFSKVEMTLVDGQTVYSRAEDSATKSTSRITAIKAGRILTVTQGEISNGVILLQDGKIAGISREGIYPADAHVIDATHSVVMPGMIDTHSYLGLHADAEPTPIAPPAATAGGAAARMRLLDALIPDDPVFTEALQGGVTAVLLAPPPAGTVCGQATLIKTLNCPDHAIDCKERVVKELAALCFNIEGGAPRMGQAWIFRDMLTNAKGYNLSRAQYERDLKQWERDRDEAKRAGKDAPTEPAEVPKNEDMEPFAALFRGDIPAFVHANRSDEILTALKVFHDELAVPMTLLDAGDSFRMVEEIQKRNTPVALGPDVTQRDKGVLINNADVLTRAGVRVLFQSSATSGAQFLRLNAAGAVHNGLDPVEALRALTIYPARALHVESRLGSIEVGKDADLVILNGDPLDVTSHVEKVVVNGKVVYDAK